MSREYEICIMAQQVVDLLEGTETASPTVGNRPLEMLSSGELLNIARQCLRSALRRERNRRDFQAYQAP